MSEVNEDLDTRIRRIVREELIRMVVSLADISDREAPDSGDIAGGALYAMERVFDASALRLACPHERVSSNGYGTTRCHHCDEKIMPENPFEEKENGS